MDGNCFSELFWEIGSAQDKKVERYGWERMRLRLNSLRYRQTTELEYK